MDVRVKSDGNMYCSTFQTLFGKFYQGSAGLRQHRLAIVLYPFHWLQYVSALGCKGKVHVSFNNTFGMSEQ